MTGAQLKEILADGRMLKNGETIVGRGYSLVSLERQGIHKGVLQRAERNGLIKKTTILMGRTHRTFFYVPLYACPGENVEEGPRTSEAEDPMRNAGAVAGSTPAGATSETPLQADPHSVKQDPITEEILSRLNRRIETQARNLLMLHRIEGASVSVQTCHTLLKAMGGLVAQMILDEMKGSHESAKQQSTEPEEAEIADDRDDRDGGSRRGLRALRR